MAATGTRTRVGIRFSLGFSPHRPPQAADASGVFSMRNLQRCVRGGLLVLATVVLAALAIPAADAATKRVILSPNADYPGFDLRTVRDVSLPDCQNTCLADGTC